MNIIAAAYFVGGLVVWKIKKENLPLYCIYLTTFGLFFLEIANPSFDGLTLLENSVINTRISSYLLILCTAVNIIESPYKKSFFYDTYKFWILLFIGSVYFLFWMNLHGRSTGGGILLTLLYVSILPIYYRSIVGKIAPSSYKKHLIIICIIEIVFVVLNLFGIPIYVAQLLENREFLIAGSFNRYNALASFVAMVGIILSYSFFYKRLKSKYYVWLIVLVIACVLMTGARMQFVWMCITIFFSCLF